jgi:hypothetical protein
MLACQTLGGVTGPAAVHKLCLKAVKSTDHPYRVSALESFALGNRQQQQRKP